MTLNQLSTARAEMPTVDRLRAMRLLDESIRRHHGVGHLRSSVHGWLARPRSAHSHLG